MIPLYTQARLTAPRRRHPTTLFSVAMFICAWLTL